MKEVPEWFPGARLNYAENILRHDGDAIAVTGARETGQIKHVSFRQLKELVREMAAAMRIHGLQKGDCVAGMSRNSFMFQDSNRRNSYNDQSYRCCCYLAGCC
jgi:acetoacetyl-CoA synthetase